MAKIGVDPDCVELARKFLVDAMKRGEIGLKGTETERLRNLSETIQVAIEDWFSSEGEG